MTKQDLPTPAELRKLLRYEPETGLLFWRERSPGMFRATLKRTAEYTCKRWNDRYANEGALISRDKDGYLYGGILNHKCKSHRVIMAMRYDKWPDGEVDHINGDRADNRIENLRDVTRAENGKNVRMPNCNTSGVLGVGFHGASSKWRATIKVNGKSIHLGLFNAKACAETVRKLAEVKFGFHPNHGRV